MRRTDLKPILVRLRPGVAEQLSAYARAHEVSKAIVIHAALTRFFETDLATFAERLERLKVPE